MKLLNFSRLKSNKNKIVKIILFIIVLIFVIYLISPKIIGQIDLSSSIKTSRKCLGKKFARIGIVVGKFAEHLKRKLSVRFVICHLDFDACDESLVLVGRVLLVQDAIAFPFEVHAAEVVFPCNTPQRILDIEHIGKAVCAELHIAHVVSYIR